MHRGAGRVESKFGENRRDIVTPGHEALTEQVTASLAGHNSNRATHESVAMRIADAIEAGHPPLRIEGTPGAFAM